MRQAESGQWQRLLIDLEALRKDCVAALGSMNNHGEPPNVSFGQRAARIDEAQAVLGQLRLLRAMAADAEQRTEAEVAAEVEAAMQATERGRGRERRRPAGRSSTWPQHGAG
jgi:hypothetical protein